MKVVFKKKNKKKVPLIRVGDTVQVIAGKNKGNIGKVLKIDWKNEKLVVSGANISYHHARPNKQQQGGILSIEAPIHYSNVLLYNSHLERGVRVRVKYTESKEKRRICVKTSNAIE